MTFKPGDIIPDRSVIQSPAPFVAQEGRVPRVEIYQVSHPKRGLQIVKVLPSDQAKASDEQIAESRRRFEEEAKQGNKVTDFTHVVRVYSWDEDKDGNLFLMMEFMAGGSLKDRLAKSSLAVNDAVRLTIEICEGLRVIHSQLKAVHRDIKPSNILLDADDNAKVADLGELQLPDDRTKRYQLTNVPPHPGTPPYMSPEQAASRAPLVFASDIYSAGCVLFEMLTGEQFYHHRYGQWIDHDSLKNVPQWLITVLRAALADDVRQRIQSADDLIKSLQARRVIANKLSAPPPAITDLPSLPSIKLGVGVQAATLPELADVSSQAWVNAVDYFWRGDITRWLEKCIAKLKEEFDLPLADEWRVNKDLADSILGRSTSPPTDSIQRSMGYVKFLKSIKGFRPPTLELDPKELNFGEVGVGGESTSAMITIANGGRGVLEGIVEPMHNALKVLDESKFACGPHESITLQVSFTPDKSFLNGKMFLALSLRTNIGQSDVSCKYRILSPLQVEPQFIDFGTLDLTSVLVDLPSATIKICNTGIGILRSRVITKVPWLSIDVNAFELYPNQIKECKLTLSADAPPPPSFHFDKVKFYEGVSIESDYGGVIISGTYTIKPELLSWWLALRAHRRSLSNLVNVCFSYKSISFDNLVADIKFAHFRSSGFLATSEQSALFFFIAEILFEFIHEYDERTVENYVDSCINVLALLKLIHLDDPNYPNLGSLQDRVLNSLYDFARFSPDLATELIFPEEINYPALSVLKARLKSLSKSVVIEGSKASQHRGVQNISGSSNNLVGIEWIEIPAGEFLYGSPYGYSIEKRVIKKPYLIAKYPITQAQYQKFIDAVPNYPVPKCDFWSWLFGSKEYEWDQKTRKHPTSKSNHPVMLINWVDAQEFCKWAKCRLPTEEEWEKAARGTDGREYPWGNEFDASKCNTSSRYYINKTTPIGQYSPIGDSPYGCADMAGNVWEWTSSEYGGIFRVLCGGSFNNDWSAARIWSRLNSHPLYRFGDFGIRVVSDLV